MRRHGSNQRGLSLAIVLGAIISAAAVGSDDPDGWTLLERVRERLAAESPLTAEFTQTFTPAGFSSGDTETGSVSLALPSCARWDYVDPFPKSFLLCGETAYAWNPGETSGRRYQVTEDEREGLDLLRLNVAELRSRYQAAVTRETDALRIDLRPQGAPTLVTKASIRLSADGLGLRAIAFEDRDENRTLFELGELQASESSLDFSPPEAIEWLEN